MFPITHLKITPRGTELVLSMGSGDAVVSDIAEKTVGSVMSAVSACVKELMWLKGASLERPIPEAHLVGPLTLDLIDVEWVLVRPLAYRLVMQRGAYRYEATCDRRVDHVVMMFQGAMKFFAFKAKLITVEDEVCWERQEASRLGVLTREDG